MDNIQTGKLIAELRKKQGLTQQQLADKLNLSNKTISKWESGKGYPSIDSLKEISNYFSVSIDDLLSGEKLLLLAEKEHKSNIQNICDLLFGIADVSSFLLVVLPLYPNMVEDYIYSVNLFSYVEKAFVYRLIYWILFFALIVIGIIKIGLTKFAPTKSQEIITNSSMILSIVTIIFLIITREIYAIIVVFLLFLIKGMLFFKRIKKNLI